MLTVLLCAWGTPFTHAETQRYFVKTAGKRKNDGTTWEKATKLDYILQNGISNDVEVIIYVMAGTYVLNATLPLKKCVKLYGGYPEGLEGTDVTSRDWKANPTILNRNAGYSGFDIVASSGGATSSDTCIDGFIILCGNNDYGIGMRNDNSSPLVKNCVFKNNINNVTPREGGGMYNDQASPWVENCTFQDNSAECGGGVYNKNSDPTFINCAFVGNKAMGGQIQVNGGGGIYNKRSAPTIRYCTFTSNDVPNSVGGGVCNALGSSPQIENCAFSGNISTRENGGGAVYNDQYSTPMISNCVLLNVTNVPSLLYSVSNAPILKGTILAGSGALIHSGVVDNQVAEGYILVSEDTGLARKEAEVYGVRHVYYEPQPDSPAYGYGLKAYPVDGRWEELSEDVEPPEIPDIPVPDHSPIQIPDPGIAPPPLPVEPVGVPAPIYSDDVTPDSGSDSGTISDPDSGSESEDVPEDPGEEKGDGDGEPPIDPAGGTCDAGMGTWSLGLLGILPPLIPHKVKS